MIVDSGSNRLNITGFADSDRMVPLGDAWCCLQRSDAFRAWHGPKRPFQLGNVVPELKANFMGKIWENMVKHGKIFQLWNLVIMMILIVFFLKPFQRNPNKPSPGDHDLRFYTWSLPSFMSIGHHFFCA